jgi:hypothetical protein
VALCVCYAMRARAYILPHYLSLTRFPIGIVPSLTSTDLPPTHPIASAKDGTLAYGDIISLYSADGFLTSLGAVDTRLSVQPDAGNLASVPDRFSGAVNFDLSSTLTSMLGGDTKRIVVRCVLGAARDSPLTLWWPCVVQL